MKLATILPTAYLNMTENDDYHMALAHLVGKDMEYTKHFKELNKLTNYVILDNSVIENAQQTIESVCRKADEIGAQEIILIDKFKDMAGTLDSSFESLTFVRTFFPHLKVMAVPQGETMDQWMECAAEMLDWNIDTLGIPKVLTSIGGRDARLHALQLLKPIIDAHRATGKNIDIHLLGCWESPLELTMIAQAEKQKLIPEVRGCDSAIAYVYSKAGILIGTDARPEGPVDFGGKVDEPLLLTDNITLWHQSVTLKRDKVINLF